MFEPVADRLLVVEIPGDPIRESGLLVTPPPTWEATIFKLGSRVRHELKKGDRILYERETGTPVKIDGIDLVLLNEANVVAVLEEPE